MEKWHGIEDIEVIYIDKEDWTKSYIEYNGYLLNPTIVENLMWERFWEWKEEHGFEFENDEREFDFFIKDRKEEVYKACDIVLNTENGSY